MARMRLNDGSYITVQTTIDNPVAYEKATKARILANANKTFCKTYEDFAEIESFLAGGRIYDDEGNFKCFKEGFVGSLASAYDTYGKLSEKQVEAVRKCIFANIARKAEWACKKAELDAKREYVGAVGEKITITLTCVYVVVIDGVYGTNYINICEDADKNIVIYKGKSIDFPNKGETATIKATIKELGVRNGVKQTVIQRPKVV
jgi:hypothetical protein